VRPADRLRLVHDVLARPLDESALAAHARSSPLARASSVTPPRPCTVSAAAIASVRATRLECGAVTDAIVRVHVVAYSQGVCCP
jgi:hypothetical protein